MVYALFTRRRTLFAAGLIVFLVIVAFPGQLRAQEAITSQTQTLLERAARECLQQKDYASARDQYRRILRDDPNAIESQSGLIQASILSNDTAVAESEIARLLSAYSKHPGITKAVTDVANTYFRAGRDVEADQLCGTILSKWPNTDAAVWSQKTLACLRIRQGDWAGGQLAFDKLLSDYRSHPGIDKAVSKVANEYFKAGRYTEADQLCGMIINQWPDSGEVAWCRQTMAKSLFKQGDLAGAKAASDRLISDYSSRPETAATIRYMADQFRRAEHHTEAVEFYQAVQKNWLDAADAIWCQQGLACSLIQQDDLADAAAAAAKLVSDYSAHPGIAKAVSQVANQYFWAGRHTEANQLCKMILANWPDSDEAMWSRQTLIRMQIREGDLTGSEYAMNKLLSEHGSHPGISNAIFAAGEEYYLKAEDAAKANDPNQIKVNYQKALSIWQRFEKAIPNHNKPEYAYFSGIVCQRLGQHEQAIVHFQRVISKWPDYKQTWHARHMTILCVESLAKASKMDRAQADIIKQTLYREILQQNPESPAAEIARKKVN